MSIGERSCDVVSCYLVGGVRSGGRAGCCFKQKTAYEMRISDWSSDVCSSDLAASASSNSAVVPRNLVSCTFLAPEKSDGLRHQHVMQFIAAVARRQQQEIGRASWRARGCQYV